MTDGETAELLAELRAAITARMGREPGPGRVRRIASLVTMPVEP